MTYSKGFFVIYTVIALCLVSFLVIMTISHQTHIAETFQEAMLMQKGLAAALNAIEELHGSDNNQESLKNEIFEVKASKEYLLRTNRFCVQKIVITIESQSRTLISLTSGVLCAQ